LNNVIELAKNNDKSFHIKFSELFPEFNQKLLEVNPQLTHSDLEYCALIKLKFDTKEIAIYKNTSISSVESKKYRIRKKLCIRTDENMYTWMINI
jgi:DNA-binding CsgD family transcriptional regulator